MNLSPYGVVIATYDRAPDLKKALASLARQTHRPAEVIVVDGHPNRASESVCRSEPDLAIIWVASERASSAWQRNLGAKRVTAPLIAFFDDDAEADPDTFARLVAPFASSETTGVAGRMRNFGHAYPSRATRLYYRLQSGYSHPHYGARVFGPAINCLPCYEAETETLIPAEWLPTTCVVYRTQQFLSEQFPDFLGYSYMEDVHLSIRLARCGRLYFHSAAWFDHHDATSTFKRNRREIARMRIAHHHRIARELLHVRPATLATKLTLHRLFASISILRQRQPGWFSELAGTWTLHR